MRRTWIAAVGTCMLISPHIRGEEAKPGAIETTTGSVERCVAHHERARILRLEEQWLQAREAMQQCAVDSCPLALRSDCSAWLDEVARIMPTLLVVVERENDGSGPVSLELDGQALELSEPAEPIEVAPGLHRLRLTLPSFPAVEREVVLKKGEKNHLVRVRFVRDLPPRPAQVMIEKRAPSDSSRPVPITTYLAAGGALAALSISAALLVSALSAKADADDCKPLCETSLRESIDSRLLFADISGGVGLALAGVAVYTFASRPVARDAAPVSSSSLGQGALFSWRGRF